MFSSLSAHDVEISYLVEVMHILGGAGITFIDEVSAIIDGRCSVAIAGVAGAGGFSIGRTGAIPGCDGRHGGRPFEGRWWR